VTDEDAIRTVINLYFQYGDDNDWDTWSTLLAEDYLLDVSGHVTIGREANRRSHVDSHGAKIPHGRHFATNIVVYVEGDLATATTDWFFVAEFGLERGTKHLTIADMGRSYDEFRRAGSTWLLAKRDIRPRYLKI
jgi:hypothetical protein